MELDRTPSLGVGKLMKERPVVTRNMIMCGESDFFKRSQKTWHLLREFIVLTYAEGVKKAFKYSVKDIESWGPVELDTQTLEYCCGDSKDGERGS